MKALVCSEYTGVKSLDFKELPIPSPSETEVLIKVEYAALNFPDTLTILGKDQYGLGLPFIPGREVAGTITAVGSKVKTFHMGQRVAATMMSGGFQEYCTAEKNAVYEVPEGIKLAEAAGIIVTYGTAFHALLDRASLKSGSTVAVLGASGGVGLAAVQLAKAHECKVIACVGSDEKAEFCLENGADDVINYSEENLKTRLKEITQGKLDVVVDLVGGDYSEQAFRVLSWEGKHLVIGFTQGEIPSIPLNLPLLKGACLTGVFWSTFCRKFPEKQSENMKKVFQLLTDGKIQPHIFKEYQFSDVKDAFQDMIARKIIGKAIVKSP